MEYLMYIAIGYYLLVAFKVIGQLFRVRFDFKKFYDDRMSLVFGMFICVHVLAGIGAGAIAVVLSMVHAKM